MITFALARILSYPGVPQRRGVHVNGKMQINVLGRLSFPSMTIYQYYTLPASDFNPPCQIVSQSAQSRAFGHASLRKMRNALGQTTDEKAE
jgi:hypothetical protein